MDLNEFVIFILVCSSEKDVIKMLTFLSLSFGLTELFGGSFALGTSSFFPSGIVALVSGSGSSSDTSQGALKAFGFFTSDFGGSTF